VTGLILDRGALPSACKIKVADLIQQRPYARESKQSRLEGKEVEEGETDREEEVRRGLHS
jgi:hypothetical protein